jgi:two-component system chemotaxis response regulator CheY
MSQILVVDDSSAVRSEVSNFLAQNGFEVITAVDGLDGLDKLKQNPHVRLIVADVNMPNMDGLTMVEHIRGELGNSEVNILMLTTETDSVLKTRGKALGIKGWIIKPFNRKSLAATFKRLTQ